MKTPKEIWIRTEKDTSLLTTQIKGKEFIKLFLGAVLPLATEIKAKDDKHKVYIMDDHMKYITPAPYGGFIEIMLYKGYQVILKF